MVARQVESSCTVRRSPTPGLIRQHHETKMGNERKMGNESHYTSALQFLVGAFCVVNCLPVFVKLIDVPAVGEC